MLIHPYHLEYKGGGWFLVGIGWIWITKDRIHRLERLDRDRGISKPSFRFTGLGLLDFLLYFFTTENDRIASTGKRERTSYLTDRIEPPEVEP